MKQQTTPKAGFPGATNPDAYLDFMYASAREAQGPSNAAWSRMANAIDAAGRIPATPSDAANFSPKTGSLLGLRFSPSFVKYAGLSCASLFMLGGFLITQPSEPPGSQLVSQSQGFGSQNLSEERVALPNTGTDVPGALGAQDTAQLENTAQLEITATERAQPYIAPGPVFVKGAHPEKNVSPRAQLSSQMRVPTKLRPSASLSETTQNQPIAAGLNETAANPQTSLAAAPQVQTTAKSAVPSGNDAALLRDVAILDRVEALLRQRQGRAALALLQSERVSLLRDQSKALTAAAQCQIGETARGRQALAAMNEDGPAATTRFRALRYCGVTATAKVAPSR